MTLRSLAMAAGSLVLLAGLSGCGVFGGNDGGSLASVDDLVNRIERLHVEAELSKERSRTAVDTLRALVSPDFVGDPVAGHKQLTASIEASQKQAETLRSCVRDMKASAEPVFEKWNQDLLGFANPALRQRSQERLEQSRARYNALIAAIEPAQTSYDALNMGLSDMALFLGHDFNATSISEVTDEVASLDVQSAELDRRLDACLTAALAYVEASALPQHQQTATPEPTPAPAPPQ